MVARFLLTLVSAWSAWPITLAAQDCPCPVVGPAARAPAGDSLGGVILGVTLDRYLVGSYGLTAVSFRGTHLTPSHWGSEFGFGLLPVEGTSNVGVITDLGMAYQSGSMGSLVLLKGGVTGVYGGGGGLFGFYGGAGIAARLSKGLMVRVDLTRRWFLAPGEVPRVWLVSVGLASLSIKR